jgi:hypothetical protein
MNNDHAADHRKRQIDSRGRAHRGGQQALSRIKEPRRTPGYPVLVQ